MRQALHHNPKFQINHYKMCLQHPGHRHLVQRDHHSADDVQYLRVPGRPGVLATREVQGSAGVLCSLPDPQHLLSLLGDGTCPHTITYTCMSAVCKH